MLGKLYKKSEAWFAVVFIIAHSMLNALSSFSNEAVINKIQIPVSVILCVISAAGAVLIFRKANRE